jgi:hypothetical protein
MSRLCLAWCNDRRGLAAVEFALVAPTLLLLLGGAIDFGLVMSGKSQLANGVAQAAQYALLQGPRVSAATLRSMVQNGSSRSGLKPVVAVAVTGPACYCASGTPMSLSTSFPVLSPTYTCTGACPASAAPPGAYLIITASYVYQPLTPGYSQMVNTVVSESVTARLQ